MGPTARNGHRQPFDQQTEVDLNQTKNISNLDDAWPFTDPPNLACFTVTSIIIGAEPIPFVSHDDCLADAHARL